MGRPKCSENNNGGLKRGPWTAEEDQKLTTYIQQYGHGNWSAFPEKAGLKRCGKSCRLRWINYLRPDIKRGKFSLKEEHTIIQLHAFLGNRWSAIAAQLPKRTDNEIKNHWNTHLKKRLIKMGIDPMTHKPQINATINDANLSHMAQWERARLEAEARSSSLDVLKACQVGVTGTMSNFANGLIQVPTDEVNQIANGEGVDFINAANNNFYTCNELYDGLDTWKFQELEDGLDESTNSMAILQGTTSMYPITENNAWTFVDSNYNGMESYSSSDHDHHILIGVPVSFSSMALADNQLPNGSCSIADNWSYWNTTSTLNFMNDSSSCSFNQSNPNPFDK